MISSTMMHEMARVWDGVYRKLWPFGARRRLRAFMFFVPPHTSKPLTMTMWLAALFAPGQNFEPETFQILSGVPMSHQLTKIVTTAVLLCQFQCHWIVKLSQCQVRHLKCQMHTGMVIPAYDLIFHLQIASWSLDNSCCWWLMWWLHSALGSWIFIRESDDTFRDRCYSIAGTKFFECMSSLFFMPPVNTLYGWFILCNCRHFRFDYFAYRRNGQETCDTRCQALGIDRIVGGGHGGPPVTQSGVPWSSTDLSLRRVVVFATNDLRTAVSLRSVTR